ncbi:MAG: hypothetical protein L6Q29_01315 [Candidatus Pacebacteria bacterium]|nr:hypothetical protein [Candidatus Paceibacterota bacterium]
MTTTKNELKRMIIETAYSSKGHFKTADWMELSLAAYVSVPMITSLLQVFFAFPDLAERIISFVGFVFAFLALGSVMANNRDKANRSIETHIDLGNKYLEIYKEIRVRLTDINSVTADMLAGWQARISELDRRTSKSKISFAGRWWSKLRIKEEMDLQWVDQV